MRVVTKLSSETYVAKWVHESRLLFEGHVCGPHSPAALEKVASFILHDMYASRNLVSRKLDVFAAQVFKSRVPLSTISLMAASSGSTSDSFSEPSDELDEASDFASSKFASSSICFWGSVHFWLSQEGNVLL
jgi:hypothetical protein